MLNKIKQLLGICEHEYEKTTLAGFRVVDGWLIPVAVEKCKKCGKIKEVKDK